MARVARKLDPANRPRYNGRHIRQQVIAALQAAKLDHVHFTIRKVRRSDDSYDITVTFDECSDDATAAMYAADAAVRPWFESRKDNFGCTGYYYLYGAKWPTRAPYRSIGFYTGFG